MTKSLCDQVFYEGYKIPYDKLPPGTLSLEEYLERTRNNIYSRQGKSERTRQYYDVYIRNLLRRYQ
jgi:hypothetical protein